MRWTSLVFKIIAALLLLAIILYPAFLGDSKIIKDFRATIENNKLVLKWELLKVTPVKLYFFDELIYSGENNKVEFSKNVYGRLKFTLRANNETRTIVVWTGKIIWDPPPLWDKFFLYIQQNGKIKEFVTTKTSVHLKDLYEAGLLTAGQATVWARTGYKDLKSEKSNIINFEVRISE